jgi:hypothetical protein
LEIDLGLRWASYERKLMQDVVTDQFVTRRNRGEVIMNPMSHEHIIANSDEGAFQVSASYQNGFDPGIEIGKSEYSFAGVYDDPMTVHQTVNGQMGQFNDPDLPTLADQALTAARAKAAQASMASLVTLGEASQTVSLLRTLMSRVNALPDKRFWGDLRDGNLRRFRNQQKAFSANASDRLKTQFANSESYRRELRLKRSANEWLQYRYGIRQLVLDIQSASDAIKRLNGRQRVRFAETVVLTPKSAVVPSVVSQSTHSTDPNGRLTWSMNSTYRQSFSGEVRAGVLVAPRLSGWGRIADTFGLTQSLTSMLDLTRFSFLLGWIFNTADVVGSVDLALTRDILGQWVIIRTYETHRVDRELFVDDPPLGEYWDSPASWYTLYLQKPTLTGLTSWSSQRTRINTTRNVTPTVSHFPSVNLRLNGQKLADILALGLQMRARFKRI